MIKRFLLSPRTVISLICAVGIFSIAGSLIPQLAERPPQFFEVWKAGSPKTYYLVDLLQLNRIFTSVWFLFLAALIVFSLALSIFYQTKPLIKSGRSIPKEITQASFKEYSAFESAQVPGPGIESLADEIKGVFEARGYRPCPADKGNRYFIFEKNGIGRWGGVIFHAGLLVVIIAAVYGLAFRKEGFVQLSQTEPFQGEDEEWQAKKLGILAKDFHPGYRLYLKRFAPAYWEDGAVRELESSLVFINGKGESREIPLSLRRPVTFQGVKIYQSPYYGYVPGLILERSGGDPVITHFLLGAPEKMDGPFTGRTDFPTSDYVLDMKFYPRPSVPSSSMAFPGIDLTVTEKGEPRFEGTVFLNQRVQVGKDTLTFAQIHYWTGLTFTQNYGMPLVYSGFALSTLGTIMMLMPSYREVHLQLAVQEGDLRLRMGGRAKKYQAIFSEEFGEMAESVGKVLERYGNHATA